MESQRLNQLVVVMQTLP